MTQESEKLMIYATELGLCLKELSLSESFVKDVLRKMAVQLKESKEENSPANERLSYYAQLTQSAMLNLQAVQDTLSALSLLMAQNSKNV